jgi:hypothetical protein
MGRPLKLDADVGRMEEVCDPMAVYNEVAGTAALTLFGISPTEGSSSSP